MAVYPNGLRSNNLQCSTIILQYSRQRDSLDEVRTGYTPTLQPDYSKGSRFSQDIQLLDISLPLAVMVVTTSKRPDITHEVYH